MFCVLQVLCIKCNGDDEEGKYVGEKVVEHREKMASNLLRTIGLEKASKKLDIAPLEVADINPVDPEHEELIQEQNQIQDQNQERKLNQRQYQGRRMLLSHHHSKEYEHENPVTSDQEQNLESKHEHNPECPTHHSRRFPNNRSGDEPEIIDTEAQDNVKEFV